MTLDKSVTAIALAESKKMNHELPGQWQSQAWGRLDCNERPNHKFRKPSKTIYDCDRMEKKLDLDEIFKYF